MGKMLVEITSEDWAKLEAWLRAQNTGLNAWIAQKVEDDVTNQQ